MLLSNQWYEKCYGFLSVIWSQVEFNYAESPSTLRSNIAVDLSTTHNNHIESVNF